LTILIGKEKPMKISTEADNTRFFEKIQKLIEYFIFFSIVPFIKIVGISITFFIFLYIVNLYRKKGYKLIKLTNISDVFLLLFLIFVLVAGLLTEDTYRERSLVNIFKINIQYIYWVFLALFIKTWIYSLDFYRISRTMFISLIIAIIYYHTLNNIFRIYQPNVLALVMVSVYPIASYYMQRRFNFIVFVFLSSIFIFSVMLVGSRTGFALIIIEFIFLLALGRKKYKKFTLFFLIMSIPIIINYSYNVDIETIKYDLADKIEPYSAKIARGLRLSERLEEIDKSLLTRKLMIEKGKKIFEKHPFFGVGPGNFTYYGADINPGQISKHLHRTVYSYNKTSAQNSFLMILSESGIFATISLLVVFLSILFKGLRCFFSFRETPKTNIYISFIMVLAYSVILVTITGTLAWFLIGLSMTILQKNKELK